MKKKIGLGMALTVFAYILLLCILAAVEAEHGQSGIDSFADALWYSLVTITTVGYGDLYPMSAAGRVIGTFFLMLSVGFLAFVFSAVYQIISGRLQPMLLLYMKRNRPWFLFSQMNEGAQALSQNLEEAYPGSVQVFLNGPEADRVDDWKRGRVFLRCGAADALRYPGAKVRKRMVFLIAEDALKNSDDACALEGEHIDLYCCGEEQKGLSGVTYFQPHACCARKYWQDHPAGPQERCILLVGDGLYAQALLSNGLIANCREPVHATQYHLFGGWDAYLREHYGLAKTILINEDEAGRDSLHVHDGPWNGDAALLERADRIIFCSDDEDESARWAQLLRKSYVCEAQVYVRTAHRSAPGIRFGKAQDIYTPNLVMKTELDRRAQQLHACYRREAGRPVPAWEELDTFFCESNRAAADHLPAKIRLLLQEDAPVNTDTCRRAAARFRELTAQQREVCRQNEHMRWLRFYGLHNWRYADVRDNEKRRHPSMVPYAQLSEKEQAKDDHAWMMFEKLAMDEDSRMEGDA